VIVLHSLPAIVMVLSVILGGDVCIDCITLFVIKCWCFYPFVGGERLIIIFRHSLCSRAGVCVSFAGGGVFNDCL